MEYADEKDFAEFLKDYLQIKKEIDKEKEKKEEKEEKVEKKKKANGFNRKLFKKLNGIEHYDRKNRKNFLLESVKFYMNKK